MKKLLLALAAMAAISVNAQPWMPAGHHGPVKLQAVIDSYKNNNHRLEIEDDIEESGHGKTEKEGKDYLFERWSWFWGQHLDLNGNIVSPVRTFEEWKKYTAAAAKKADRTTAGVPANWIFQGPDSCNGGYAGLGRINRIACHPTDANTVYVGTAGGGPWKTTDGGHSWTALYNNLPSTGVTDITINPLNANTIYVCTGDADGYDDFSMGVMKSTDGGTTWNTTGLIWTATDYNWARSLIINPQDTNTLFLATNIGVMVTHDAGASWSTVYSGDFNQVLYNPADTNVIYASRYSDGTLASSQVARSTDGGLTWAVTTSLTGAQRIALAVCPAAPTIVKAVASDSNSGLLGIYSSTDDGGTFAPLFEEDAGCTKNLLGYDLGLPTSTCNGQGWYDLCIAINPTDPSKVIVGGINNYYSTDGGSTWAIVTQWWDGLVHTETVHADKHHLVYNPLDLSLYEACDGGIYRTTDPANGSWNDLTNGMGITEFYRNAVDNNVPWCIGGAQDNGTKMINGPTFTDLTGGDGMLCRIDPLAAATTWFCSYPNGSIDMTVDGGATYGNITGGVPTTSTGDWITPYWVDGTADNILLLGIDQVFISWDQGGTWNPFSPVFVPGYNINNIVMTYTCDSCIYTASDNNSIHITKDFGATWHSVPGIPSGNISRIIADPKDANILWVTFSGYGGTKAASCDLTTFHWTLHNGTLPDVPVNCITIDSFSGTKYIGTDVAVFYMDTTMTDWALYNTNLPAVIINDLNINYTTNELWAATFGRGMWKTGKHEAPNEVSIIPYAADIITVAPNPAHGSFTISTGNNDLKNAQVQISLIAHDGKTVLRNEGTFSGGSLSVATGNVAPGAYICQVTGGNVTARCRIILY